MASVAHFLEDAQNIINEIESRLADAESKAVSNFVYTRIIQRVFRGYITRKHIALLHSSATCIQRNWRGFLGRNIYRNMLKEKFDEMCFAYYNAKASIIQKWWKGYWIRSRVFSYYRLKTWLAFVAKQNKLLKCSVEVCHNKNNATEMKQRENEAKEWIVYILFKLHHLLRTHQFSGIYSLPNTTELSEIEKLLKCLKYKDFMIFYNSYMEDVRQSKAKELPTYILQHSKYKQYEKDFYEYKSTANNYLFSKEPYEEKFQIGDLEMRENEKKRDILSEKPEKKSEPGFCLQCICENRN